MLVTGRTCAYVLGACNCSEPMCLTHCCTGMAFEVSCVHERTVIAGLVVPDSCLTGCKEAGNEVRENTDSRG